MQTQRQMRWFLTMLWVLGAAAAGAAWSTAQAAPAATTSRSTPPRSRPRRRPPARPQPARPPAPARSAPKALTTERGKALTERLLVQLNAGAYKQALAMMSPMIQQTISTAHLKKQAEMRHKLLGAYQKGSLSLVSRLTLRGQTRLVWRAKFKRESGVVLVLLDARHQLVGFVIQSPSLVRAMRQERPASRPQGMPQLNRMADALLDGYNKGQWSRFCQHCSKVMKQVFSAQRFASLRKVLLSRYGKYKSRRLYQVRELVSLQNAIVVRYKATFEKRSGATLQFVFQRTGSRYQIAGWKVK